MNHDNLPIRRILVTGGAGFVGSWLVRLLLERTAAEIVVFDNLRNGRREFLPADTRLTLKSVDITDAAAVSVAVSDAKPDTVFHLAALHFIPYCNEHPAETMQVNVVGTQNVLEALRAAPPARLVIASTAAVYPIFDGPNREDHAAGPTDIYGLSKWVNEQQLELHSRQTDTRCAAARLFNVIGSRETNPHVLPVIVEQVRRGETVLALGNVKPKRDYIHGADVAEGLLAIATNNTHRFRTFNLGTGEEHSVEDLVAALARISGLPLMIRVDPARVRPSDRPHLVCDHTRATQELGWKPSHTLESALRELWNNPVGR